MKILAKRLNCVFYMLGSSYYIYISESMFYLIFRSIVSCSNDIQYKKDNMQHIISFTVYASFHSYSTFQKLGVVKNFFCLVFFFKEIDNLAGINSIHQTWQQRHLKCCQFKINAFFKAYVIIKNPGEKNVWRFS